MPGYVQPVAQHRSFPERLLLRADDDRWYVWTGEVPAPRPEEIAASTAAWLLTRCWMFSLPKATAWVHVDDLPLAPTGTSSRRS